MRNLPDRALVALAVAAFAFTVWAGFDQRAAQLPWRAVVWLANL